ncbi:hypothetical protein FITA111629_07985 [Filibacter tadaridae]|uniref:Uncharacterized protein n=1 Tax=Filibacter tadaridae TaxID=2483811 RepID=A0A3P5WWI6_9BACL|nr:hypothetical protein FILTAD_01302 [Filibacter tadaridae]
MVFIVHFSRCLCNAHYDNLSYGIYMQKEAKQINTADFLFLFMQL